MINVRFTFALEQNSVLDNCKWICHRNIYPRLCYGCVMLAARLWYVPVCCVAVWPLGSSLSKYRFQPSPALLTSCSELNKTKIYYIAQSDIGGMLPRQLVESTLPSAVMDFYLNIRKQIEDDGCQEFSFWASQSLSREGRERFIRLYNSIE